MSFNVLSCRIMEVLILFFCFVLISWHFTHFQNNISVDYNCAILINWGKKILKLPWFYCWPDTQHKIFLDCHMYHNMRYMGIYINSCFWLIYCLPLEQILPMWDHFLFVLQQLCCIEWCVIVSFCTQVACKHIRTFVTWWIFM